MLYLSNSLLFTLSVKEILDSESLLLSISLVEE